MYRHLSLIPLVFLLTAIPLHARIIHVPGDSTTIQGGINGAVDGDTVMVSPGTYREHDIDFLGKAITVMGTDPRDSAIVAATVVDANAQGTVFVFHSTEDSMSILAGLTVIGGYATDGGGINCNDSSPTVTHCTFRGNIASIDGGGMYNYRSSPVVTHCTFSGNSATWGGGMSNSWASNLTVTHCTFSGNSAGYGGGIYTSFSNLTISNCTISENSATHGGGVFTSPDWTVINCTISENSAVFGGGILNMSNNLKVTHCILWNNTPDEIDDLYFTPIVTYSDVQGGYPGEGNIDADPLFFTLGGFEYFLDAGSPCIDAGIPSTSTDAPTEDGISDWHPRWPDWIPNGPHPDMGAYGGPGNVGWLQ